MTKRGRPKGPERVGFALRLLPHQKEYLEALSVVMDGGPPVNGLIQDAISEYVEKRLSDPNLLKAVDSILKERGQARIFRSSRGPR
jgi:hypothetical protein